MIKYILLLLVSVVLFGTGMGVVYGQDACSAYLSEYDCVYQHTLSGSVDPVDECGALLSGCVYDGEFSVDTQTCTYDEFTTIHQDFEILYPGKDLTQLHQMTMQQCKALTSTGDTSACFDACGEITTGSALSACMSVCMYDDSFGEDLAYMPTSCNANCEATCQGAGYLSAHCTAICTSECATTEEKVINGVGGTLNYCGDGNLSKYEECDDGNNTNGDGCNYNCKIEPDFYASGSDEDEATGVDWDDEIGDLRELLIAGSTGGADSSVREQLRELNSDDLSAFTNEDPEELPKAGAYLLDTLTSKILLLISFLGLIAVLFIERRTSN